MGSIKQFAEANLHNISVAWRSEMHYNAFINCGVAALAVVLRRVHLHA